MINKIVTSMTEALDGIADGATIMISGFGGAGLPFELVDALLARGTRDLTLISNNAGSHGKGISKLVQAGRVAKVICSFPRQPGGNAFDDQYRAGKVALELVPQGTLAERIRAAGAGIAGFYTPTGVGTELAEGKESRIIQGERYLLEYPLHADYALIKADTADRWGNLTYRRSGRNFGPLMASAARCTIVQAAHVVELGGIDPEVVVTPSIYVQRVITVPEAAA